MKDCRKEVVKINYKSDFDFKVILKDHEGEVIGFPDVDFRGRVYTESAYKGYEFGRQGGRCRNCMVEDGQLRVICDNHGLAPGEVKVELTLELSDTDYNDGFRRVNDPLETNLLLTEGPGDDATEVDIQQTVPYVYISAWELARRSGYTGTEEEYIDFINRLPEIVAAAEDMAGYLREWAEGKRRIIESLKKWGVKASDSDSLERLSAKIQTLPVKGENEEGVISSGGYYNWDLLNELNNHQRKDYPYCYGVETDEGEDTLELFGADAYYTSDGYFYEKSTSHKFDYDETHIGRYVIFYFKNPDYICNPYFSTCIKVICLNGRPRFNIPASINITSLESYTDEKYELVGCSTQFMSTTLKNIYIKGVTNIEETPNTTIFPNSDIFISIDFPDLKKSNVNGILYGNNQIKSLNLPNYETLTGGNIVTSCSQLKKVYLPNLITANGYVTNGTNTSPEIYLPKLKTINTPNRLIYNHTSIKPIELPELEELLNGTIFGNCNQMTGIYLPKLKRVVGSGRIIDANNNVITEIELPSLEYISCNTGMLLTGVPNLKHLSLPKLKTSSSYSSGYQLLSQPFNKDVDLTIDMPSLEGTRTTDGGFATYIYSTNSTIQHKSITVNLGAPQDGYIYIRSRINPNIPITFNIQEGFRSYFRIDYFTNISKECLEDIISKLGDNNDYPTLQIVVGATNLAKISDEYKLMATNKNYTLS